MNNSLFTKIKSYTPTVKKDSKEDYLTELFTFILNEVDGLANAYCKFLVSKFKDKDVLINHQEDVSLDTQVSVSKGRIDLLIRAGDKGFICEHKVDSGLGINQIKKYKECSSELGSEEFYTVLVTRTKLQHTQKSDISLVWGEVCGFLEKFKESKDELDPINDFLVEQLIQYLRDQGLGVYENIKVEEVLSNFLAQSFLEKMREILYIPTIEELRAEVGNLEIFKREDFIRKRQNDRWGRCGIELFENWNPGIFVGIIFDPKDHKIEPLDKEKGPDFVILVDISEVKNRAAVVNSNNFQELTRRLKDNSGEFDLIHTGFKNKYRLLALRKSFLDIIQDRYTLDEQIKEIKKVTFEGLKLMLQDDLLYGAF